ncbi:MAG: hypothetical protein JRN59_03005 [Nitrososphaerota archaeon]|nr:hypothetical protein [Nitrososphaerota archaeon]
MRHLFGTALRRQRDWEVDSHSILETRITEESVKITARFEGKTWQQIADFARRMGYTDMKELVSMLFSYGVSEVEGADVERRRPELYSLGGRYAAMKFEAYQQFTDNLALSMALSTMLPENRGLRKLAAERGLIPHRKEPWDNWTQEDIDGFLQKYIYSLKRA